MTPPDPPRSPRPRPEYHEPLPDLVSLPGWLWRKAGRWVKVGLVAAVLAIGAAAAVLIPSISESNRERRAVADRDRVEQRARLAEELRREQRPISGRAVPADSDRLSQPRRLQIRTGLLTKVSAAIQADARRRVETGALTGPIRGVQCERFPRGTGDEVSPERLLTTVQARYSCVAITSEFKESENSVGGIIGHQYRLRLDFGTGRYAFCKITGRPGVEREQIVTIPRKCGGD